MVIFPLMEEVVVNRMWGDEKVIDMLVEEMVFDLLMEEMVIGRLMMEKIRWW